MVLKRAIYSFVGCVVGMAIAAYLLPGILCETLEVSLWAGAVLGVVYLVLRPLLRLVALPLSFLTMGLIYVALDALLLWFAASRFAGISIATAGTAVVAAVVVNVIRAFFGALAGKG